MSVDFCLFFFFFFQAEDGIRDVAVTGVQTCALPISEADPSGDWAPVLLALDTSVCCHGPKGERSLALGDFFKDAYTTALGPAELLREVIVQIPPKKSGGAYLAFKRCAPVYASASAAVQLTLGDKDTCADARIVLGCVGLTAIRAKLAEAALRGTQLTAKAIETAAEAARAAAEPQSDMRGSAEYKRRLVAVLVKRAIGIAARRARGEQVEARDRKSVV